MATHLHLDRKTVRKYWQPTDWSPTAPTRGSRPSQLDPYQRLIDHWWQDDALVGYKPRHTAPRISDRLPALNPPAPVSSTTGRRSVHAQRQRPPHTGPLTLTWHPGEAPGDCGEADIREAHQGGAAMPAVAVFPTAMRDPCSSFAARTPNASSRAWWTSFTISAGCRRGSWSTTAARGAAVGGSVSA